MLLPSATCSRTPTGPQEWESKLEKELEAANGSASAQLAAVVASLQVRSAGSDVACSWQLPPASSADGPAL